MFARRKRLIAKGGWTPGLQPDLALVFMILMSSEVIMRGLDYLGGDRPDVTQNLTIVEAIFPLQVWGLLLTTGGATFLAGVLSRRFGALILGSLVIFATYGALTVGLFLRMVDRGWPWDGFRTPLMFAVFAAAFAIYAFSTYLKRSALYATERMRDVEPTEEE